MKKTLRLFFAVFIIGISANAFAQRYVSENFTNVKTTDQVVYGQNWTVITIPITGSQSLQDLQMTVYEPAGDTVSERPLVIFIHTGSFLPKGVNSSTTGERQDSAAVEICRQLAKRGYVAAAMSYRLGWNPLGTQDERTGTLINSVYRAIQDAKVAVRYFRKGYSNDGNPYGIDPNSITLMGQGSGGYIALAYATLDKGQEIQLTKFFDFSQAPPVPYVDTLVAGNYDAFGGDPAWNYENHVGYANDINLVVNLGGALGDSSWLEQGDVPMVSFHCPSDPFAPYAFGPVIVPTTGDFVVDVSGSYEVARISNQFGNNDVLVNAGFNDVFTQRANAVNDGYEGLFPFVLSTAQSAPWEWWDPNDPNHSSSIQTNPDMSKTKAMAYIDTIMGYFNPRAVEVLGLDTSTAYIDPNDDKDTTIIWVGKEEMFVEDGVKIYPNPSNSLVNIYSNNPQNLILNVELYDMTGKAVKTENGINSLVYSFSKTNLPAGLYFIHVKFENSTATRKVIFR